MRAKPHKFFDHTRVGSRSEYFLEAFRELNPNVNVDALTVGMKVRLPTNPPQIQEAAAVVATVPGTIQPIFAFQSSGEDCKPSQDSSVYPYDIALLLDVLTTNKWRFETRTRLPINVLVADSGLFGARQGVFGDSMLVKTGPSWDKYVDDSRPLNYGPEPVHGTQVASLVLGGPFFARVQAAGEPRVALVIKRIYRKYALNGQEWFGPVDDVWTVINRAIRQHHVEVVNLSLKTTTEIDALRDQFAPQFPALFIAAAGNLDGALGPAHDKMIYSALYGGSGVPNLLVVAALDGEGNLASFSNHSPEFVEIGAPGCSIPVFSYDVNARNLKIERLNGTSLAAPLVSFAAALTRSERIDGWTPIDVKRRLLIAADLRPNLAPYIADGRVLNVVKSVAIFQDVVEVNDSQQLILGDITFVQGNNELSDDDRIDFMCSHQPKSLMMRDIFKIVPNFKNARNETVTKIYYRSPNALFTNVECDQLVDTRVLIRDKERDVQQVFTLDQIKDIVRKDFQ